MPESLDYERPRKQSYSGRATDVACVCVVVCGYAALFWVTHGLWSVPPGAVVRPMGPAAALMLLAIGVPGATVFITLGAPGSLEGHRSFGVRHAACLAAVALSLLAYFYIPLVARLRGFYLGD